ncbi:EcsC family protein [Peribacillus alkalitolerans]|uniref:EcsC family protein n=1 Tax=Peribacillus alkalitolerans TaxID=1550385 RepID=UPI0013D7224F|nr:EcsC family protein [Peribacillus alkalitolerans]
MAHSYNQIVMQELTIWKNQFYKKSGMIHRFSKQVQNKVNAVIPEKAHQIVTEAIKGMVKTTLTGATYTTKKKDVEFLSLEEMDKLLLEKVSTFRKTAMIEGAGTGAGGILLGLADFPLLLSIKMKFLFEAASIYGFDTKNMEERVFILYVFQLAFSSDERRREVLDIIENWEEKKEEVSNMDWRQFQQEYRDYIDVVKFFQLVPVIGAAVGAYANYQLLQQLGETTMNCYRMRRLSQ